MFSFVCCLIVWVGIYECMYVCRDMNIEKKKMRCNLFVYVSNIAVAVT